MLSKTIYELTKILIYDYVEGSDNLQIECRAIRSGYFSSSLDAESFIRKHNYDKNSFFILRTFVLNPTHSGQGEDFIMQRTYNCEGNLLCDCPTYHFIVNYNELHAENKCMFKGRDNCVVRKNSTAWFYDDYEHILQKCKIGELPFNTNKAVKFDCLNWYDDSYIVYPLPIPNDDNHQHIISCFVFSNKFINDIMKKEE